MGASGIFQAMLVAIRVVAASCENEVGRIAFADITDVEPIRVRRQVMDPQGDLDAPSIACCNKGGFNYDAPTVVFQLGSGRVALGACGCR